MLKRLLLSIVVNTVILIAVSGYMESFYIEGIQTALIASVLLSVINVTIKPLLSFLALPITVLSLGIFQLIVNAFMLEIVSFVIGSSFDFRSFGTAILASVLISVFNGLTNLLFATK